MDLNEVAPPSKKHERMVKHIKKSYKKDGKLTDDEESIAYATAWKDYNKESFEIDPKKHKKQQKQQKIRNMTKSPNENEANVAKKKAKGPELFGEGLVSAVKKGIERDKKAKQEKKIKDRKAVPYAALAAETELEGEVIDERIGGAGTLVRQGIKVGGKKGGRVVQAGTTSATSAGKAQVARASKGKAGAGNFEKAGALVGGTIGGLAGVAIPDGPAMVAGEIAGGYVGAKAGGKIGRQIDKIGAKKPVTTEAIERQAKDRKKLSQPHSVDGSRRDHSHDVDSAMTDYLPRKGKGRIRPASKKEMRTSAMRDAGMTTEGVQSAISNLLARKKKENKKPTPPTGAEAKIQKWRQERKKEEHNKYVNFLDPED